jgi:type II secretory pathway pseudopilin PulG
MKKSAGFTIIELIVSIGIFAFMTALVISRYGSFNQGTLLTNMAYDMALTVRTAQSYGVSVKSVDSGNNFGRAYGIHFAQTDPTHFTFFVDTDNSKTFNTGEEITTYTLTSGVRIFSICLAADVACTTSAHLFTSSDTSLDILYKRPNPNAVFVLNSVSASPQSEPIALITLVSSDGSNKQTVVIRRNGQISVGN